jgi:hypothetical protein
LQDKFANNNVASLKIKDSSLNQLETLSKSNFMKQKNSNPNNNYESIQRIKDQNYLTTPNSPTMKRSLSCNNTAITRINLGPSKINLEKKKKMFLDLIQNHRES